jgi:hypothetical protein
MVFLETYRLMNDSDTQDMFTIFKYANDVSGEILMPIMLAVVFFIALLGSVFSGKPISRGLTFASFVCSILGMLLVIMHMLSVNWMYFAFFLTGIGVIWTWLSESLS